MSIASFGASLRHPRILSGGKVYMYRILEAEMLADKIYKMVVEAPFVARACQPGEFLITKIDDKGERMKNIVVWRLVRHYLGMVTTQYKKSPHVLRHTFATSMLNHDADLEVLKELLGHESISTTEIYTHTTFEELKEMYNKAHPRA